MTKLYILACQFEKFSNWHASIYECLVHNLVPTYIWTVTIYIYRHVHVHTYMSVYMQAITTWKQTLPICIQALFSYWYLWNQFLHIYMHTCILNLKTNMSLYSVHALFVFINRFQKINTQNSQSPLLQMYI
jgi:hypothetical protein